MHIFGVVLSGLERGFETNSGGHVERQGTSSLEVNFTHRFAPNVNIFPLNVCWQHDTGLQGGDRCRREEESVQKARRLRRGGERRAGERGAQYKGRRRSGNSKSINYGSQPRFSSGSTGLSAEPDRFWLDPAFPVLRGARPSVSRPASFSPIKRPTSEQTDPEGFDRLDHQWTRRGEIERYWMLWAPGEVMTAARGEVSIGRGSPLSCHCVYTLLTRDG